MCDHNNTLYLIYFHYLYMDFTSINCIKVIRIFELQKLMISKLNQESCQYKDFRFVIWVNVFTSIKIHNKQMIT